MKRAGAPTGLVVVALGPPPKSKHHPPTGDPANVLGISAKLRPLKSQSGGRMGGVDSMANYLSEKGPVDEGSPSDERGGA